MVVYHGTGKEFDTFDLGKIGSNTNNLGIFGKGFYSSNRQNIASDYRRADGYRLPKDEGFVMPLYYKLEKPFIRFSIALNIQSRTFKIGFT